MRLKYLLIIGYLFLLLSCRSDRPEDIKPVTSPLIQPSEGVFITNEGNFQWGNASVSYYKYSDKAATEDVFKAANNRPLGDVCQSMEIFNEKAYVVVNNSGKVEIVNPQNFISTGVIQGLTSPRYFLGINNSKAYITDFKSNAISVVDLNSNTKIKDIPCPGWTEELVLVNSEAFVTNIRKKYIYVINILTDEIDDSIQVGFTPNSIRTDKNGKLWVLCGGNSTNNILASLYRIDPATKLVEFSIQFTSQADSPWKLDINGTKDTLYYLNNGVYQLPINNNSLPASALIPQNNDFLFYGIGIEPASGIIYVSDAIDYVQKGKVYRYNPNGTLINTFNVGIIPSDFYFY